MDLNVFSIFTLLSWFKRKLSRLISPHEIYFICKTTFLVRLHLQSNDGFYFNDYNTTYPVGVFPERELRQITNSRIWMNCSEWDMLWTDRRHRMRFVVYLGNWNSNNLCLKYLGLLYNLPTWDYYNNIESVCSASLKVTVPNGLKCIFYFHTFVVIQEKAVSFDFTARNLFYM